VQVNPSGTTNAQHYFYVTNFSPPFHMSQSTSSSSFQTNIFEKDPTFDFRNGNDKPFVVRYDYSFTSSDQFYSETDSTIIFLSMEKHVLSIPKNMYGLSTLGVLYMRSLSVILYACMICMEYFSYCLEVKLLRRCLRSLKDYSSMAIIRKASQYITMRRHIALLRILVALLLLLLLCGDVHPNPGPALSGSIRHPHLQLLTVGAWNVRTLLETKRTPVRPTAIVARELDRNGIDIAALGETRILGESRIVESGGGYTFFLKGKPVGDKHYHGVGFAIRTRLVKHLDGKNPVGINERLMTMSFPLKGSTLSIISAYAPTLPQSDEVKDTFYDELSEAIGKVPASHKLLVMGDFNARVGSDHLSWEDIIGRHGVGNENSNGTRLLSLCAQNELCITNTFFQQADRHKTTWMHPGSKKWHMIDYVITRRRDIKEVFHTRAMCGSTVWSDHRLVRSKLAFEVKAPQHRHRLPPKKKPDLSKLQSPTVREILASKLQVGYDAADLPAATATASWNTFKDITLKICEDVLGYPARKNRDWFDENDPLIKPLLNRLHILHVCSIKDSTDNAKADLYRKQKREVQTYLRNMQDAWWKARAAELQSAADKRDFKTFYQGLKAVHGPVYKASQSIKSKDGVLLTEPSKVLDRWAEHFEEVLNQDSRFDMSLLDELPQYEVNCRLDDIPTLEEVQKSFKQISSGKAPGEDGIPPEIYIHGGASIAKRLLEIVIQIWQEGEVVQDFRDATVIHLYKNKGERTCCDNHRGISLLCIAGKILMRLILNRLSKHITNIGLIPESQCGFVQGKSTADSSFALQQLQEKCRLQNQDLYLLFIDLTKAFDTVNREGLWCILEKAGCPKHFASIIRSFHDNMKATVREGSDKSLPFSVTSGTKQGCIIAPTLFSIFFSMMLHVAFKDAVDGINIKSRFDIRLTSIATRHFNAKNLVSMSTIRELLFADDCALAADTVEGLQRLCDCFSFAARRFGLTISIKKTEVLYQPARGNAYIPPAIFIEGKQLKAVELFKYLGSIVSKDASADAEIAARIAKATAAFGRLSKRLWKNRNIRVDTKISVYKAAVVTSLLFGCETWTLKRAHIASLERFHQTSLRKIARIRWFHKVTNYEVLDRCKIGSIQSMVESAVLRWTGHVTRMSNDRIPKRLLYGRLASGRGSRGNHASYMNQLRRTLDACGIPPVNLEVLAESRGAWRSTYKAGIAKAEGDRINRLKDKRVRRKLRAGLDPTDQPD
jgi:hypothetical protein